jgi:hypothetical protein
MAKVGNSAEPSGLSSQLLRPGKEPESLNGSRHLKEAPRIRPIRTMVLCVAPFSANGRVIPDLRAAVVF